MTIEEFFSERIDLHWVPKKVFLRVLAEYTEDPKEKEELLHLCTREGKDVI
jgi:hypothetical protein